MANLGVVRLVYARAVVSANKSVVSPPVFASKSLSSIHAGGRHVGDSGTALSRSNLYFFHVIHWQLGIPSAGAAFSACLGGAEVAAVRGSFHARPGRPTQSVYLIVGV